MSQGPICAKVYPEGIQPMKGNNCGLIPISLVILTSVCCCMEMLLIHLNISCKYNVCLHLSVNFYWKGNTSFQQAIGIVKTSDCRPNDMVMSLGRHLDAMSLLE